MLPRKFKTAKPLDILSSVKAYIIKNYDATCFDKNVETFLTEVQQNRNVVSNLNDLCKNDDAIKTNKEILLQYINQLSLIKSKITFGKEDYCVRVNFEWMDSLKDNKWSSYNINFEYYSNIFNLGKMYYILGASLTKEANEDDAKLKESIKYFQYAAGFFDMIKNEAPAAITPKELPYDLSPNYMTFCSNVSCSRAQINLLKVAKKKKSGLDLQAKLCKGIADMLEGAALLCNDSLKKYIDDTTRNYVLNRRYYWTAMSYSKMKELMLEGFNQNGQGFGEAISYQAGIVSNLQDAEKYTKKIKNLIEDDELKLSAESQKGTEMYDQNKRIYFQPSPELESLPKIQQKIMANPSIPQEFKTDIEGHSELDALIPREVKNMINEYKSKMMNFITENLNNYENDSTIQQFLNDLGLPSSLECVLSQSSISDSLWKKIHLVQEKGGSMYLQNLVQALSRKPEDIERRINDSITLLNNEDAEDKRLRNQYGSKWNRRVSSDLNGNYLFTLNDYKNKLAQARNCDNNTKKDIMENLKYFELIGLSREQLNERIPKKVDAKTIQNCKEATSLRKDLDELEALQAKAMEIINKVFNSLNEDNVAPQFIQVLQKKTTENSVFDNNKQKFEEYFKELASVSDQIKALKVGIQAKNEVFLKIKNETFKPDLQNEQFFKSLDNYVNIFHQKENFLQLGLNFYKQFDGKLNELNRNIADFLMARDMDKNQLIKSISSGGFYQESKSQQNDLSSNYWDFTKQSQMKGSYYGGQPNNAPPSSSFSIFGIGNQQPQPQSQPQPQQPNNFNQGFQGGFPQQQQFSNPFQQQQNPQNINAFPNQFPGQGQFQQPQFGQYSQYNQY